MIFIWCSLKTNFWKKINSVDSICHLIFKINSQVLWLPEKKMLLSWWDWLFRFCWACGLELPVHALDRNTGVCYLFFFNRYLTFLVAAVEAGRGSCVSIVHCSLDGMSSLNLFSWRRLERRNGRKVGAIFNSL